MLQALCEIQPHEDAGAAGGAFLCPGTTRLVFYRVVLYNSCFLGVLILIVRNARKKSMSEQITDKKSMIVLCSSSTTTLPRFSCCRGLGLRA